MTVPTCFDTHKLSPSHGQALGTNLVQASNGRKQSEMYKSQNPHIWCNFGVLPLTICACL